MKVKSDKDSTGFKKVSLIDELGAQMSYNAAAEKHQQHWSDLSTNIRLKLWKNYTFSLNARFATYALHYQIEDKDGKRIPHVTTDENTEWHYGRFGRFQGMSQNFSYTLNPESLKKLFGKGDDKKKKDSSDDDDDDIVNGETNADPVMMKGQRAAEKKGSRAETDEDGYMHYTMPWSLTFSYGISMREDTRSESFKPYSDATEGTGRYSYKWAQTLNFSGNVQLSQGWNISFSSGYDFDFKKLSMTTASLSRDLHCFSMSCSMVLAPYTSYNFSFRCNASTLTDVLKYDKRSGYSNAVQWY